MRKWRVGWIGASGGFTMGFVLGAIGTVRYASRMPNDWVGIGLYAVTTILFAVAAVGFYLRWVKESRSGG